METPRTFHTLNRLFRSKIAAAFMLLIIVALIAVTFTMRVEWWMFIDVFFAFMMVFMHFMALMLFKMNRRAAIQMDRIAIWCGVLFVISFLIEAVVAA